MNLLFLHFSSFLNPFDDSKYASVLNFAGVTYLETFFYLNEEVLVLISWVIFVVVASFYSSTIIENTFEETREKFYKNLVLSFDFKKKALEILINYYKLQFITILQIKKLFIFSRSEINKLLIKRQASFKFIIASQIENRLSSLIDKEIAKTSEVKDNLKSKLSFKILSIFNSKKKKNLIALKKNIFKKSMLNLKIIASA
jgi:hypothetical protein